MIEGLSAADRGDLGGGHSGEMQADDGSDEQSYRNEMRMLAGTRDRFIECQCGQDYGNDDRGDDIGRVPFDQPSHMIRRHARVVHEGDAETHDRAAEERGELLAVDCAEAETDAAP